VSRITPDTQIYTLVSSQYISYTTHSSVFAVKENENEIAVNKKVSASLTKTKMKTKKYKTENKNEILIDKKVNASLTKTITKTKKYKKTKTKQKKNNNEN